MKILHTVESYDPSVGGMQEVVKQLSERLVELGHEVTVATSYTPKRSSNILNGVHIKQFKIGGSLLRGFQGEESEIKAYAELLLSSDFDVIVSFASQQWATDLALPLLRGIKARKVFVTTWIFPDSYKVYVEKTKEWITHYDSYVYLTENAEDMTFAKEHHLLPIRLVTNAADEKEFLDASSSDQGASLRVKLGIPEDHLLILHVGSHTGKKGHAEALAIFGKAKLSKSTLLLVGNTFGIRGCALSCKTKALGHSVTNTFHSDKQVLIKSLSREDTVAAYKEADIFLFPSNIEASPIVLFEAMAAKTPFLTTDVGNSKEIIEWSQGGELLPTIKEGRYSKANIEASVKVLEALANDETKRKSLGENGFKAWREKFTWQKIASEYESLYKELTGK